MTEPTVHEKDLTGRQLRAMDIVARYTLLCAIATRIPYWWMGSPSITGLQLKMLAEVSAIYDVEFSQDLARKLIGSFAGGCLNQVVAQNPLNLAFKAWVLTIPVVGIPLSFATAPAVTGAYAYVLGRAFVRHYEAGGNYHTFSSDKVRTEAFGIVRLARA